jgi:hypothetical protein
MKTRWVRHVAHLVKMRNSYRTLVGKSERKRPLVRYTRRRKDNIKVGIIGFDSVD